MLIHSRKLWWILQTLALCVVACWIALADDESSKPIDSRKSPQRERLNELRLQMSDAAHAIMREESDPEERRLKLYELEQQNAEVIAEVERLEQALHTAVEPVSLDQQFATDLSSLPPDERELEELRIDMAKAAHAIMRSDDEPQVRRSRLFELDELNRSTLDRIKELEASVSEKRDSERQAEGNEREADFSHLPPDKRELEELRFEMSEAAHAIMRSDVSPELRRQQLYDLDHEKADVSARIQELESTISESRPGDRQQ